MRRHRRPASSIPPAPAGKGYHEYRTEDATPGCYCWFCCGVEFPATVEEQGEFAISLGISDLKEALDELEDIDPEFWEPEFFGAVMEMASKLHDGMVGIRSGYWYRGRNNGEEVRKIKADLLDALETAKARQETARLAWQAAHPQFERKMRQSK